MSDRAGWARKKTRTVMLYEPEQLTAQQVRLFINMPVGFAMPVMSPRPKLETVAIPVRPARFISHAPAVTVPKPRFDDKPTRSHGFY